MALLPKPTAEQIKARMAKNEIGLITANQVMRDEWLKANLDKIAEDMRCAKFMPDAHNQISTVADGIIDLVAMIKEEI